MVGGDALGGAVLAGGDVRAAEAAPAVLGVAAERAPAERGLAAGGGRLGDRGAEGDVELAAVEVVVPRDVARELGALELVGVGGEHGALDLLAAHRVDRVGDVGVELGAAVGVADRAVLVEPAAALVAEAAPEVVLGPAVAASVGQLAGRHGDEEALGPLDDLEITDDEHVVERDAAERLQPLVAARVVFHELDANFGDFHSQYSFTWRPLLAQGPQVTTRTRPSPSDPRRLAASSAASRSRARPK